MKSSGSLLDIHKYSKDAFRHLYYKLSDSDFNRSYKTKDDPIASVTGIIWDITQGDEEVKKIVKKMDQIDGIKAQNSKSGNEKRVETWLKKAYFEHLYRGYSVSRNILLKFMTTIIKPNDNEGKKKLKYSSTRYFE